MRQYRIRGERPLSGRISVHGSKNAVLPIIAAAILNESESIIHNCPLITDMQKSVEILESIGCSVKLEGNTLIVNSSGASNTRIPNDLAGEMRSSVFLIGAMLGRFGAVETIYPGGCKLGLRSIDMHMIALENMGAEVELAKESRLKINCKGLNGIWQHMRLVSVGATENVMLAAVKAKGTTKIENAAREPEIVDLQRFLNAMGADVHGAGTDTIIINGVEKLHSVEHTIVSDRIVAGTYLTAAAVTGSKLTVTKVPIRDISPIIARLMDVGCGFKMDGETVTISPPNRLRSLVPLRTEPHPGYPTDMQAQMVTALTLAEGTSIVKETIFEGRDKHIAPLKQMGANINVQTSQDFVIQGVDKLHGAAVKAEELRGGAALILAALAAEGETVIENAQYVERGYEKIEDALASIGADIKLEEV